VTVSLSSRVRAITKPEIRWRYGDDDDGAAVPEELPWRPPASVNAALKADAHRSLAQLDAALKPAERQLVKDWLLALGTLCAGQMSAADAKTKIAGYAGLLEHPPLCFTRETLRDAARRFKWWPSFAEIAAFLDEIARPTRHLRARVKALTDLPVADPDAVRPTRRYKDLTPEERAKHDAMMAACRRALCETTDPRRVGRADYTMGRAPAPEIGPAKPAGSPPIDAEASPPETPLAPSS
jgi:hypothetical protein